jgi:hypothetical protein
MLFHYIYILITNAPTAILEKQRQLQEEQQKKRAMVEERIEKNMRMAQMVVSRLQNLQA